jgi:hypothetical protein
MHVCIHVCVCVCVCVCALKFDYAVMYPVVSDKPFRTVRPFRFRFPSTATFFLHFCATSLTGSSPGTTQRAR